MRACGKTNYHKLSLGNTNKYIGLGREAKMLNVFLLDI